MAEIITFGAVLAALIALVAWILIFDPFHPGQIIKGDEDIRKRRLRPPVFPRPRTYKHGAVMKAKGVYWLRTVDAYDGTPIWAELDMTNEAHRQIIRDAKGLPVEFGKTRKNF